MYAVQPYYEEEVHAIVHAIKKKKGDGNLLFALVADTHLSDNGEYTRENIAAVDAAVGFDFMIHLGDFLTGTTPEKVSRRNLREELCAYRNAVESRILYVVQGNHDGYRDESYRGQVVDDIALDENWYEDTCFIDEYPNVHRPGKKPYYYVDVPDKKLRMV